jgi:hypothetical protein
MEVGGFTVGTYPHAPQNKLQLSTQSSTEYYVTKREQNKITSLAFNVCIPWSGENWVTGVILSRRASMQLQGSQTEH